MSILSDSAIKKAVACGDIVITPYKVDNVKSNSYDVTLSENILVYTGKVIDLKESVIRDEGGLSHFEYNKIPITGGILNPNQKILAVTNEFVGTLKYRPCINGKSGLGRCFLTIHQTAGYGDVGFGGHWTLEIIAHAPVIIYPNMPIAQIEFQTVEGEVEKLYGANNVGNYMNKYSDDPMPQVSEYWRNFQKGEV